jgi:hypothetical protein
MQELNISDDNKKGYHAFFIDDDFEYQNPIEKTGELFISTSISQIKNHLAFARQHGLLSFKQPRQFNPEIVIEKVARTKSLDSWEEYYNKMMSQKIPSFLLKVLESSKKKEQAQLLKNASLTEDELTAFIFKASRNSGFTLSRYRSEHHHNGLDVTKLPLVGYKNDEDAIVSLGKTFLTPGEIKQAINNRKVVVARFLDKGPLWHCFFLTFRGLKGEEVGGKSHLHFISHTWGRSRQEVLAELRSKNYKLGPLPHIDYVR